ncbi:MAG: hypothetical protein KTR31_10650 [Myxococcales bacterium]|nr:hypothetical protein [Myxococcales bacterium]
MRPHDPVLTLDRDGIVLLADEDWFDGDAPARVGTHVAEVFAPEWRSSIRRMVGSDWIGAEEIRPSLPSGRSLLLRSTGTGNRWLLELRDATVVKAVEDARQLRGALRVLSHFARSVAGELTDPVSIAQGRLELLRDLGVSDPTELRRHVEVAFRSMLRVTQTVHNVRQLANAPVPELQRVFVAAMLRDAQRLLGERAARVSVELEESGLTAGGDHPILARVLAGLMLACLDRGPPGRLLVRGHAGRDHVELAVGPAGRPRGAPGASTEELDHLRVLLQGMGGRLRIFSDGADDLHFEVRLSRAPSQRARKLPVKDRLLLVGSRQFRQTVQGVLDMDGFAFHEAADPSEAFNLLRCHAEISAVAVEMILPEDPSGLAVAEAMVARHPELCTRVLVAGQPTPAVSGSVTGVPWPMSRGTWLAALGRRVRRS